MLSCQCQQCIHDLARTVPDHAGCAATGLMHRLTDMQEWCKRGAAVQHKDVVTGHEDKQACADDI